MYNEEVDLSTTKNFWRKYKRLSVPNIIHIKAYTKVYQILYFIIRKYATIKKINLEKVVQSTKQK